MTNSANETLPGEGNDVAQVIIATELARWTHAWAAAANETYRVIDSPAGADPSAIGQKDVLTLVFVDAVRNVVRGADQLLGSNSGPVQEFLDEHRVLKVVRDRFEHFDAYIQGAGFTQRAGRKRDGDPLRLEVAGLKFGDSYGGGREGHVIEITVYERDKDDAPLQIRYEVHTRLLAIGVRKLARSALEASALLDQRHLDRCEMCADPEAM